MQNIKIDCIKHKANLIILLFLLLVNEATLKPNK